MPTSTARARPGISRDKAVTAARGAPARPPPSQARSRDSKSLSRLLAGREDLGRRASEPSFMHRRRPSASASETSSSSPSSSFTQVRVPSRRVESRPAWCSAATLREICGWLSRSRSGQLADRQLALGAQGKDLQPAFFSEEAEQLRARRNSAGLGGGGGHVPTYMHSCASMQVTMAGTAPSLCGRRRRPLVGARDGEQVHGGRRRHVLPGAAVPVEGAAVVSDEPGVGR